MFAQQAGDILYIPPMYLHSGVSLTNISASMSVCSESAAERVKGVCLAGLRDYYINLVSRVSQSSDCHVCVSIVSTRYKAADQLQHSPLPFELEWSFFERVVMVREYIMEVLSQFASTWRRHSAHALQQLPTLLDTPPNFIRQHVLSRYRDVSVAGSAGLCGGRESVLQSACTSRLNDETVNTLKTQYRRKFSEYAARANDALFREFNPTEVDHNNTPGIVVVMASILLADHLDVLATFMLGADDAACFFQHCFIG